jgi:anaerobic selenocysteine-containing dehydrogenase
MTLGSRHEIYNRRNSLLLQEDQLEFLGEAAEVVIHPDDAAAAGLADDQPLIVRSEHDELTGVAKVDAVS